MTKAGQQGRQVPGPAQGGRFWRRAHLCDGHPLGNLIYFGTGLTAVSSREPEPALIDPRLSIDPNIKDCRGGGAGWQPSYARCSPQARGAYLLWLNKGRTDAHAPASSLLLYFHGLERRALHDAASDPAAAAELPDIRAELARLLSLYGAQESFGERARALVDFLGAGVLPAQSYLQPPLRSGGVLTCQEQMSLGQCGEDGRPLPAAWAFRWVQSLRLWPDWLDAPGFENLRDCFTDVYQQRFGEGLVPPRDGPRLQLRYWPSSPTFDQWVTRDTPLPSLTEQIGGVAQLVPLAGEVEARLSRHGAERLGRGGSGAFLARPLAEWPQEARSFLAQLRGRVSQGTHTVVPLTHFQQVFPELRQSPRGRLQGLCEALGAAGVGMMPDPRFSLALPRHVRAVLFMEDPASATGRASEAYRAAALRFTLAAAVMAGDRLFFRTHEPLLTARVWREKGLTLSELRRLAAHLQQLLLEPPALGTLKLPVAELPRRERERARALLVTAVRPRTAGAPLPLAVKLGLARSLGLLAGGSVQPAAASAPDRAVPLPRRRHEAPQIRLDSRKVAALQKEQERITALLEPVFAQGPEDDGRQQCEDTGLAGLDPGAAAFLRALLAQSAWPRQQLLALARGHGLPLDGVLERLNEACYEQLDMPLFEEGDPLLLIQEAIDKLDAGVA